jgi:hypothetical protein
MQRLDPAEAETKVVNARVTLTIWRRIEKAAKGNVARWLREAIDDKLAKAKR